MSAHDALLLATWYATLALAATVGWLMGRSLKPLPRLDNARDDGVYRALTIIGAVGVIGMYLTVEIRSPGLIVQAFRSNQFNLVRQSVPLSAGIATLRYATVLSGAIGLHKIIVDRQWRVINFVNLALLAATVMVASRLALIMCGLIFIGLSVTRANRNPSRIRISPRRLLVAVIVGSLILILANYTRNANYYRSIGIESPMAMAAAQSVTYLDAPFQVSVGAVHAMESGYSPSKGDTLPNALVIATPTFLSSVPVRIADDMNWYRGKVSVDPSLTTNSAIAALYGALGLWALPFMIWICLCAGSLMGYFSRYRSYLVLASFVIGYCFAELWRTFLFSEGIAWFLVISLIAGCVWASRGPSEVVTRENRTLKKTLDAQ